MENKYEENGVVAVPLPPVVHSHSHSNGWIWRLWPAAKPFVNGGLVQALLQSSAYVAFSATYHTTTSEEKALLNKQFPISFQALRKIMPCNMLVGVAFNALRFGSFEVMTRKVYAVNNGIPLTIYQEACCGLFAGTAGGFISGPACLALSRMQANIGRRAALELFNCRNAFHTLYGIFVKEGVSALWKGAASFAKETMVFNMVMFPSYNRSISYFRESLGYGGTRAELGAGFVSGFLTSAFCLPYIHVLRYMRNMQPDADGKYPVTGSLDYTLKVLKCRGPFVFYTGFGQYLARTCPPLMMTWMALEEIRRLEESNGLQNSKEEVVAEIVELITRLTSLALYCN